jgi:ParB family chromosome partitioning protein
LGALIPSDLMQDTASELRDLPISSIESNRFQPRGDFDEDTLIALSESIRELGVLQPVLVRPLDDDENRFELVAGERRLRAAKRAGLAAIPAIIRAADDLSSLEQALVENLHRDDLNVLEEGAAYQQLMEDFNLTQEEVASRVGRSRSAIANTLRLFQLSPGIQRMVGERRISAGHARALLGTPDRAFQDALAQRICDEGLSVRQTEDVVRRRAELTAKLGADPETAPDEPQPERAKTTAKPLPPAGLLELQELLADYLDTTVNISLGRSRGKIVLDFANLEDLERIYRLIAASSS